MKRKIIAALMLVTRSALMFVASASAHNAGPCNESGDQDIRITPSITSCRLLKPAD